MCEGAAAFGGDGMRRVTHAVRLMGKHRLRWSSMPLHLPALVRGAFAAGVAWVVVISLWGADASWWTWPAKLVTAGPTAILCALAAWRPRASRCIFASGFLFAWAVVQILRILYANYEWRTLAIAGTTYGLVAMLSVVLGLLVSTVAVLTKDDP